MNAVLLAGTFALALVLTLALTPVGIRVAWLTGYLDHPEARKLHTSATALLGGAVVFLCAFAAWFVARLSFHSPAGREPALLMFGATLALALGLWDDRRGMRPLVKLAGQALAAGIVVASGAVPAFGLGSPWDPALAMLGIVALMNAVNFLDNMNGMVAGLSAIALGGYAWISYERGAYGLAAAQLAVAGACVGFLHHNFPRAKVFLGDAGSLFLGYCLGASAVLALDSTPRGWGWFGPLMILAYPAFDLVFVVVNRLREGRKVYQGGKDHSNHRIARVLRCQTTTVILMWLAGAALCASGLVVLKLAQPMPALLMSGLWLGLFLWAGLRLSFVPHRQETPSG
jgi:UDP-GlcNAc:undecaprenyl-phosphate GlcNAc-1-phosphate transferase